MSKAFKCDYCNNYFSYDPILSKNVELVRTETKVISAIVDFYIALPNGEAIATADLCEQCAIKLLNKVNG